MTDLRDAGDEVETRPGIDAPDAIRRRRIVAEPLGHVASLDGLRAVAVLGVLLYHAGFGWIPGGFLGVSTFFTLSGFLITSLMLREWNSAHDGSIDLRRFWQRRFRRLLPASWITIAVVLGAGAVGVWNADQLRSLRGDVPFALAEIINWHFIAQDRSYGASFEAPSPLEHFWSLAVEQQFYIVLPLVVALFLGLGARRPAREKVRTLVVVLVVLTAFSAISNGWYARTSIDRAYFGTDTRMAEMLIGSLLACATLRRLRLPAGLGRTTLLVAGIVASAVTVWLWHAATLDTAALYPWGLLLSACCTATIILAAIQGGPLGAALGWGPLVWLGRISYGVYLLHWPIFLWLTPLRVGWAPVPLFALRLGVTIAGAVVMYHLIEHPVRTGARLRGRAVPIAVIGTALALLAGTWWVTRDVPPPSSLQLASQAQATTTTLPPPRVATAVLGDQLAAGVTGRLTDVDGLDLTPATTSDCGLALGGYVSLADGTTERDTDRCAGVRGAWVDAVTTARPDVVLVMPTLRDAASRRLSVGDPWAGPDNLKIADFIRTDMIELTSELAGTGTDVILATAPNVRNTVAPTPMPPPSFAPDERGQLEASERRVIDEGRPGPGFRENEATRIQALNAITLSVAEEQGLQVVDLAEHMAQWPGGEFDPELRAADGIGLTDAGAAEVGEWLLPTLRERLPTAAAPPPSIVAPDTPLPPAPPSTPRKVVAPGVRPDVLVLGDSVAYGLGYGLADWGASSGEINTIPAAQFGCAVARGGSYRFQQELIAFDDSCNWGVGYPAFINSHRPHVVLLSSGIWEVVDRRLPGDSRFRHIGAPDIDRYILGEFLAAIDLLSSDGATVVVLTQPHMHSGMDKGLTDLPESEPERIDRLNQLLAEAVGQRSEVARLIDLQGWLAAQPGGELDPVNRPDGVHFSDEFSPRIAEWLGPQLAAVGRGQG